MEEFIKACKKQIMDDCFVQAYMKDGMPKSILYSSIMIQVIHTCIVYKIIMRKLEIFEFADHEFKIKINHDIEFDILPTERRKAHG